MNAYETWWENEGSAIRPFPHEDIEEFAHRITNIAWFNGTYCARNEKSPPPPTTTES